MFWDWIQFLLSMQQSFKWVRACADVHTLKVIESITAVMFTAGRVEEEEMEERKQCLRQCYRLFQSKVDMFYFKNLQVYYTCLGTSCLVRSALCSRTLPRSKIDSWHILQTPEPLLGHTWNTPCGRRHKHSAVLRLLQNSHSDAAISGGIWRKICATNLCKNLVQPPRIS